jgi:hypothetical protein
MLSSKSKPVIEDIKISKEKLRELNSEIKARWENKNRVIREYLGGTCTYCAAIPSKVIKYDIGDAKLVE